MNLPVMLEGPVAPVLARLAWPAYATQHATR